MEMNFEWSGWNSFLLSYQFKLKDIFYWVLIVLLCSFAMIYLWNVTCSNTVGCNPPMSEFKLLDELSKLNYYAFGFLFLVLAFLLALQIKNEFVLASSACVIINSIVVWTSGNVLEVLSYASSIFFVLALLFWFVSVLYPFWLKRNGRTHYSKLR